MKKDTKPKDAKDAEPARFKSLLAGKKPHIVKDEFTKEKIRKEQAIILICVLLLVLLFLALLALHLVI